MMVFGPMVLSMRDRACEATEGIERKIEVARRERRK